MNAFTATAILALTGAMGNLVAGAPAIEANGPPYTRRKITTTSTPTVTTATDRWTFGWPSGLPVPILTTIHPSEPTITITDSRNTTLHTRHKLPQTTSTADVDVEIEYVTVTQVVPATTYVVRV
ncbi:hypothetical protein CcaCcLH18_12559 [Colletotrichum camelliae]|nr:hypothetical protein CcaCcLH18_12559 [Colletotrichum camelliae]